MFKIAKKELQLLFYSPVAWFLLVLFIIQTALVFTAKYDSFVNTNMWGGGLLSKVSSRIFMMGLWGVVQGYLYFYIPLLTMGLVSREFSSGSIKLLYSSPITNAQIILGKFFSMVVYSAIMSGILLIYVLIAWGTVQDFQIQAILTGLLGLFLVTCTYAAVGIFVSSLTSYQFVAAMGTFIVLLGLNAVRGLWQEYDFIRDVTYWLSINGRASTFVKGMICSEDLLYFPLVTALFLSLTIIRLNTARQKVHFAVTLGKNVGVVLLACTLGYLSSRPSLMVYYDATANKTNTLTPVSQDVVARLEGGLSITGYTNILSPGYGTTAFPGFIQRNRNMFQTYERFKPEMKLKMVYYYDTITEQDNKVSAEMLKKQLMKDSLTLKEYALEVCKKQGLNPKMVKTPEEIRKMVDLTGERTFAWQIVRGNGEKSWLRTYVNDLSAYPGENEITITLKRMVMDLPKIGFVKGYGLRSHLDGRPQGYSTFAGEKHYRNSLLNQGFDVMEVDLAAGVPADVDILTIADVREPFSPEEEKGLEEYINRGGNLYILGEPRRRDVMNPLLSRLFGVQLGEGTLVQYRDTWLHPEALYNIFTPEAKEASYFFGMVWFVVTPGAAPVEQVADRGFKVMPMLVCDTLVKDVRVKQDRSYRVWNEMESLDYSDKPLEYNPAAGEVDKLFNTGVMMTRMVGSKEQRVILLGDADCISNGELLQKRSPSNPVLITGGYHYLSYGEMPADMRRAETTDKKVFMNRAGYKFLYGGLMIFLPLLCVGTGVVLWIRRRSR